VCDVVIQGVKVQVVLPSAEQIRECISLHPYLVHLGKGILLPRKDTISQNLLTVSGKKENIGNEIQTRNGLILTPTTSRNLLLLGTALCTDPYPPPILVCGPRGSGKSSLIRELVHLCSPLNSTKARTEDLLELHVDEETDSKTLLGSYVATDIPGEFTWRPGALTNAVLQGKWVLLEDVDSCPSEIQAALVKLLEERILPLGTGRAEKCHPKFRMFGTCTVDSGFSNVHDGASTMKERHLRRGVTTAGSGGKRLLHPGLWRKVHVEPLPYSEVTLVCKKLYPSLPNVIHVAALTLYKSFDKSGRKEQTKSMVDNETTQSDCKASLSHQDRDKNSDQIIKTMLHRLGNSRDASVRDLIKLLSRISSNVYFEPGVAFCTESQRTNCMAEAIDVFTGWHPCFQLKRDLVRYLIAPAWDIPCDVALRYLEERQPKVERSRHHICVGRSKIDCPVKYQSDANSMSRNFADTNYALRLMESVGVCINQNEATLLVGGEQKQQLNYFSSVRLSLFLSFLLGRNGMWEDNIDSATISIIWSRSSCSKSFPSN
jgi:midasin